MTVYDKEQNVILLAVFKYYVKCFIILYTLIAIRHNDTKSFRLRIKHVFHRRDDIMPDTGCRTLVPTKNIKQYSAIHFDNKI